MTSQPSTTEYRHDPACGCIPPLEPGDRLTREEFERRYEAMSRLKKAELIEGTVYLSAAVRLRHHGRPNAHLVGWLVAYESETPGVLVGDNSSARLDMDNEPQPDGLLMIDPECGGQASLSDDDYVEESPELVGEVSSSTASFDLHAKLDVYRRNGVCEYIVWRVLDRELDWFVLRGSQYERHQPHADGWLRSEVFSGLWLDSAALLRGDMARVLAVVRQGLASPEHAAFVAHLEQTRTTK